MMQILTRNLGWKLASLLIAFALWIVIAREPELATSLSIPIEFNNIPDDLDIGSNVPDRIHVEVRGPSGRLSRDNLSDLAVVLDLSGAHVGERTYTIHPSNTNLPVGVEFYRAGPFANHSALRPRYDSGSTGRSGLFENAGWLPRPGLSTEACARSDSGTRGAGEGHRQRWNRSSGPHWRRQPERVSHRGKLGRCSSKT